MSGWVTGWVLRHVQGVEPTSKLVMIALADEANDEGHSCFPSVPRIATAASCSVNTARAHLLKLETAGLIVVNRPERQGRGHKNYYGVVMGRPLDEVAELVASDRPTMPKGSNHTAPFPPKTKGPESAPFTGENSGDKPLKGPERVQKGSNHGLHVTQYPKPSISKSVENLDSRGESQTTRRGGLEAMNLDVGKRLGRHELAELLREAREGVS